MKNLILIFSALAAMSCQSSPNNEMVMGSGRLAGVLDQRADQEGFYRQDGGFVVDIRGSQARLDLDGLHARRGGDELGVRFTSWGRQGAEQNAEQAEPRWGDCVPAGGLSDAPCQRRVEYPRQGLTEYWESKTSGLEQSWDVASRPAGEGLLALRLELGQALDWQVDDDGRGALVTGSEGGLWRYAGLGVWDAMGEPLKAWMEPTTVGLLLLVDDADAVYPLLVDPTLTQDTKLTASGGAIFDYYGFAVSNAGDTNGDGYDDVIVGAYQDDCGAGQSCGSAHVYMGSINGVDLGSRVWLTASVETSGAQFGRSVSGAGDVNGDGYDDVIVGAWTEASRMGRAYLYFGSIDGIDLGTEFKFTSSGAFPSDYFGVSVSGAGDVNGDGYDDVIVGAYADGLGAAYVYFGSINGLDLSSEVRLSRSDEATEFFAYSVSNAGDVNGDGYDDVVIGSYRDDGDAGAAYVYLGSATGIDPGTESKLIASDATSDDEFGYSVSGAGDVDGDGYDDLIIGAHGDDDNGLGSGSAYVYYGSVAGVMASSEVKLTASDGGWDHQFGWSVSSAGDVDGDGYDEVIVGARKDDVNALNSGSAYVYAGGPFGIGLGTEVKFSAGDGQEGDYFGAAVSGAGDVDGDGYEDVLVGAFLDDDRGLQAGSAYVFHGSCTLLPWYADSDSDGYGDASTAIISCLQPAGYVSDGTDCNDSNASVSPDSSEVCDAGDVDENCSGAVDDADPSVLGQATWYADLDSDGYGDVLSPVQRCDQPSDHVADATDCDDTRADVNPAGTEVCDANDADEDCSGASDDDDPSAVGQHTWYADADSDGYGAGSDNRAQCNQPSGYVLDAADCDDANANVNPGEDEICDPNDVDEDCSGLADDDDPGAMGQVNWHADADSDGYGDPLSLQALCEQPSDHVMDATDCDDGSAAVNPGEDEVCDPNDVDEDCSGLADDNDPGATGQIDWYLDADSDGFGDGSNSRALCEAPAGTVADGTDCDDSEATVFPGAPELCDGQSNDCDSNLGVDEVDGDGDGYAVCSLDVGGWDGVGTVTGGDDCDDSDATVYPGAEETMGDGVDSDCDGGGGPSDDDDGDGLSWTEEQALGTSDAERDSDGDGLDDGEDPDPLVPEADSVPDDTDPKGSEGCGCSTSTTGPHGGLVALLLFCVVMHRRAV